MRGACRALGVTGPGHEPDVHDRAPLRGRRRRRSRTSTCYRLAGELDDEDPALLADELDRDADRVRRVARVGGELPLDPRADGARAPRARGRRPRAPWRSAHDRPRPSTRRRHDRRRRCRSTTRGAAGEVAHDPAPGERPGHATQLLPLAARAARRGGARLRPTSSASASASGRGRSPACGSASRPRARSRRRRDRPLVGVSRRSRALAAGAERARPCSRSLDARRGEAFVARLPRRRARCSRRAALAPEALAAARAPGGRRGLAGGRRRGGTIPGRSSKRAGAAVPADGSTPPIASARRRLPARRAAGASRARRRSSRTTCARRTPRWSAGRAGSDGRDPLDPPPHLRGPPAGHRDRAPRVPDAVVAGDVRARAVQAGGRLPRGAASTSELVGYLDLLALRHRLARHERRRRPATLRRQGIATALLEGAARARSTTASRAAHARGAPVERGRRSRSTSASASASAGAAAPLLPGQRRGRAHHVAHAGDARRGASTTCPNVGPVASARDPRDRDELRRHLRGGRHARRRDPLERRSPRRASTTATAASSRRSPRATTSS